MFIGLLFQVKLHLLKYSLTQWISKLLGSFEIHWVRLYLLNFMGLVGIVNSIFYKTKPIFKGLGHEKMSWFLTLGHTHLVYSQVSLFQGN